MAWYVKCSYLNIVEYKLMYYCICWNALTNKTSFCNIIWIFFYYFSVNFINIHPCFYFFFWHSTEIYNSNLYWIIFLIIISWSINSIIILWCTYNYSYYYNNYPKPPFFINWFLFILCMICHDNSYFYFILKRVYHFFSTFVVKFCRII